MSQVPLRILCRDLELKYRKWIFCEYGSYWNYFDSNLNSKSKLIQIIIFIWSNSFVDKYCINFDNELIKIMILQMNYILSTLRCLFGISCEFSINLRNLFRAVNRYIIRNDFLNWQRNFREKVPAVQNFRVFAFFVRVSNPPIREKA